MPTAYELHLLSCVAAAEAWERAAETARLAGRLDVARRCSENAIRNRWLAEPDPELKGLFDEAIGYVWTPNPGDRVRLRSDHAAVAFVHSVESRGPDPVSANVELITSFGHVVMVRLDEIELDE